MISCFWKFNYSAAAWHYSYSFLWTWTWTSDPLAFLLSLICLICGFTCFTLRRKNTELAEELKDLSHYVQKYLSEVILLQEFFSLIEHEHPKNGFSMISMDDVVLLGYITWNLGLIFWANSLSAIRNFVTSLCAIAKTIIPCMPLTACSIILLTDGGTERALKLLVLSRDHSSFSWIEWTNISEAKGFPKKWN
jgi:hypothetical protein